MAVVDIPSGLKVSSQGFGLQRFDLEFGAGDTGASQTAVLGPPRLVCGLTSPERLEAADAALWRSMVMDLAGRVNRLAVHALRTPAPLGTARGVWTVASPVAAGAIQMTVNVAGSANGGTLLRGDWIGVQQMSTARQLLHVQANATVIGGQMSISFRHPLRAALVTGSEVVWHKPTALFKQTGTNNSWTTYPGPGLAGFQGGFSLDLIEDWGSV